MFDTISDNPIRLIFCCNNEENYLNTSDIIFISKMSYKMDIFSSSKIKLKTRPATALNIPLFTLDENLPDKHIAISQSNLYKGGK